jgi:catecholate siderophore receptor
VAALSASGLALLAGAASAQQLAEANTVTGVTIQVQPDDTGIARMPQPIEDLPQTVHVIDAQTLREQGVTSLDRAVRNIPGITADTGEGGGSVAGDQFRIRGFSAANDISTDGLRDFGVYTRDTFNTEAVQVFLGPSGATFGRGSFGGAINQSSKFATAKDAATVQGTIGTADLGRFTADVNHALSDTSGVRVNAMLHHNAVDDIDEVEVDRMGLAVAGGWGLGTDTSFELMYFHQQEDRTPYYGVPVYTQTGVIGGPLPVDRSNFYGTNQDRDKTEADVITARFQHRANENFQIRNDTRVGVFDREFLAVAPSCSTSTAAPNPNPVLTQSCVGNFFDGNPSTVPLVTRGGANGPYYLQQWGVQNVTTTISDFEAFGVKHQFVAGVDLIYEEAQRRNTSAFIDAGDNPFVRPPANALNPDPTWNNPLFGDTNTRESESTDYAFFASEQIWLTEQFSLLGSVRWDQYEATSDLFTYGCISTGATGGCIGGAGTTGQYRDIPDTVARAEISETLFSPRVSAIWEPGDNTIVYVSWARSEQPPSGTALASVGTPIDSTQTSLDPTTSETYEIGARFPLFTPDLLLGVSVFHTERDNAQALNDSNVLVGSGDSQEVQGVEVSLSGQITERWAVDASYTYLDTETTGAVTSGAVVTAALGKPIPFASEHSATLWTTYSATPELTFGFGARYTDEVWLNNTNTAIAPEYISFDAMATYFFDDGLSLQLNGTNLADRDDNYDQLVGGRAAHAPGRAFALSLTKNF